MVMCWLLLGFECSEVLPGSSYFLVLLRLWCQIELSEWLIDWLTEWVCVSKSDEPFVQWYSKICSRLALCVKAPVPKCPVCLSCQVFGTRRKPGVTLVLRIKQKLLLVTEIALSCVFESFARWLGGNAKNDQTSNMWLITLASRQVTWSLLTNQMPVHRLKLY